MPEVFTNLGLTTVSSGGTTAPVSGTVETWTVASSASFPAAVTGGNQFRVVEDNDPRQSEIILVTNVSGTTWTVTRGAEGTTPVAHTTGFTIVQVISKATMDNWLQLDNVQTVTGAKTFAATTTMQTADGSQTLSLRARLTANGGQSATLLEFRDLNGSAWTSVDTTGNISSLVSISGASLVAGNNLGSQGNLILNKIGPATSGTTNQNSALQRFRTAYWNGSVSTDDELTLTAIRASVTPGDIDLTLANGRLKVPTLTTTGTVTAAGLLTASSGVTIPLGQPLTVGTKKTFSGTVALAATANAATVLGQFSSTAGSMALRLHIHLVTGSVQRTKTYEVVVDTATDTTNTYYKLLPADQSTAQAAVSDVALEIYRPSTATTTWQIWVRTSATFASTGALTWSAEGYGDTVVTYASTLSPATSASGSPITVALHPSNALDTVAGNVGIGTDAPNAAFDVRGSIIALGGISTFSTVTGTAYYNTGLQAPAQNASRYVGSTISGPPGSGTWVTGDWVIDQTGHRWFCTLGGTPGTWVGDIVSGNTGATRLSVSATASPPASPATGDLWIVTDATPSPTSKNGWLGTSNPGTTGTATTTVTIASITVTVPSGAASIRITGMVSISTVAGVGATVSISGCSNTMSRTVNHGSINGEVMVVAYDQSPTAGSHTYNLQVASTVATAINWYVPALTVDING